MLEAHCSIYVVPHATARRRTLLTNRTPMQVYQRLLLNSMPKSGTHLLPQVIDLLGYQDFWAHDGLWPRVKDRMITPRLLCKRAAAHKQMPVTQIGVLLP